MLDQILLILTNRIYTVEDLNKKEITLLYFLELIALDDLAYQSTMLQPDI